MTDTAGSIAGTILERFSEKRAPTENEYLGDDGLLYCSKCHTPVQCRVNMFGSPKIVGCVCKCRREEEEKRKAQEREMELQRRIRQLKANRIQEKHLLDWRFEVADDNKDIQMAKRYVENWSQVKEKNLGLLLWRNYNRRYDDTVFVLRNRSAVYRGNRHVLFIPAEAFYDSRSEEHTSELQSH